MGSTRKRADIVIYDSCDNIVGIVETKAPEKDTGDEQLMSYMQATSAKWGLWTNGEKERHYFKDKNNHIKCDSTFQIPRYGKSSVGEKSRVVSNLTPASDLRLVFAQIRKELYANANLSRTEKQGAEMIRLLFCKIYDELENKNDLQFKVVFEEREEDVKRRIETIWKNFKKDSIYGQGIFKKNEVIELDSQSLVYVVRQLQNYSLMETDRDIIGDAFEVFADGQLAGEKGQYFTPRLLVKMMVRMIKPSKEKSIIDVACGSGGFLIYALDYLKQEHKLDNEKAKEMASSRLFGIDKDTDLVKICRAYMCLMGDGKSNIVKADSLDESSWDDLTKSKLKEHGKTKRFDIILTNPPFGSKIKVTKEKILKQFSFAKKESNKPKDTPPQILFIELCLNMLNPGGVLGIVLPDGIFGNPKYNYIRDYILHKYKILAVIDCHPTTFQPFTGNKCSVLILRNDNPENNSIFMGIVNNCGHTTRGTPIYDVHKRIREDFSLIAENYISRATQDDETGFYVKQKNIHDTILSPQYYNPVIQREINELAKLMDVELMTLGELEEQKKIIIKTVGGVPRSEECSPSGEYRFIKTSDVFNYELNPTPLSYVDEDIYIKYKDKQDLEANDIIFVKDGNNKIGNLVLLQQEDLNILLQGHFHKIRCVDFNPLSMFYLLTQDIVRKQIRRLIYNQGTLWTIGSRIRDIQIPVSNNNNIMQNYADKSLSFLNTRRQALEDFG